MGYGKTTRRTNDVRPGLLYNLIKDEAPLPANFETRRQREERQSGEHRRQQLGLIKDVLKTEYEEYCRLTIDRFISDQLTQSDFERRVGSHKAELSKQGGLWEGDVPPAMIEQMARHAVRAEI